MKYTLLLNFTYEKVYISTTNDIGKVKRVKLITDAYFLHKVSLLKLKVDKFGWLKRRTNIEADEKEFFVCLMRNRDCGISDEFRKWFFFDATKTAGHFWR